MPPYPKMMTRTLNNMQTQIITSDTNEKLKVFKSLTSAKGIKEHQRFILSGSKLIEEFLNEKLARFKPVCFIFESDTWPYFIKKNTEITKFVIPKAVFKEIDVVGTNEPLLVLEFKDFEKKDFEKKPIELELICPLGDPRNLGALVRSAVGFGVREIILTKESAHPYLPQAVKASAGAALYAEFKKTDLALAEIPVIAENIALDLEGKVISAVSWPKNLRLWIGEEGPGLKITAEQKKKLQFITIPTQRVESLNAMVSAALAIWEWKKSNSSTSSKT